MKIITKDKLRFESKIDKAGDCWLWTASIRRDGYGRFKYNGMMSMAHRISYELYKGPIPKGLYCLHSCDNPLCVNPKHLRIGSHQDNMDDKVKRGRGSMKLTEKQVLEVRAKYIPYKYTTVRLAKEYGVSAANILFVVSRKTWNHI